MTVAYDVLPEHSRLWIYQSARLLTDQEVELIQGELTEFTDSWNAHGSPVKGLAQVRENLFIVLMADEKSTEVSGCSIDGSVHILQKLGAQLGIDFFGRLVLACQTEKGLSLISRNELGEAIQKGLINRDTEVYQNTVSTKAELETIWKRKLSESWAASAL